MADAIKSFMNSRLTVLGVGLLLTLPLWGQDMDIAACKADISQRAAAENLPQWITTDLVASLEIQPRVIELDRTQPETGRKALFEHFGTYRKLRAASPEKLAEVQGISKTLADRIHTALHS